MKRQVRVGESVAHLSVDGDTYRYSRADGTPVDGTFHLTATDAGSYLVQLGNRSFRVSLGPSDEVSVNGNTVRMHVLDPRDYQAGGQGNAGAGRVTIAASMPGKVVRVLVAPEDQVEAEQGLIVVEAMKMQNEMKAPRAGRVTEVRVAADATVLAGDILVVID
jgi:acetyl/propionyl-CoA carboxylase alpha subunit